MKKNILMNYDKFEFLHNKSIFKKPHFVKNEQEKCGIYEALFFCKSKGFLKI